MKLRLLLTGAIAAVALSGCATYETAGPNGPGGYYQGRPQTRYYDGYGYGYPGSIYGGYYGSPYYYDRQPYYGYYGPYYPYYAPPPPRPRPPDNGGHHPPPPPGSGPGGNRPAPWRDPTRGAWRDHGEQPMVPGQSRPVAPGAQPYRGARPPRPGMPPQTSPGAPSTPRVNPGTPATPRAMPRSTSERPAGVPRVQPRGGRVKVVDP